VSHIEIALIFLTEFAVLPDQIGLNSSRSHVCHVMAVDWHLREANLVNASSEGEVRRFSHDESELGRIKPAILYCKGSITWIETSFVTLCFAVLVQTELWHLALVQVVTMEQDPHDVMHGRVLTNQEALVLAVLHQNTVPHPH